MKPKENIQHTLDYLQAIEDKPLQWNEEAIVAEYQKKDENQSRVLKIVSFFGGIVATIAFLALLISSGIFDSTPALFIFGIFCIVMGALINKLNDTPILDALSVSFFITGFILLGGAIMSFSNNTKTATNIAFVVCIIIAFIALIWVQRYLFSLISVLIIHTGILCLIIYNSYKQYNYYSNYDEQDYPFYIWMAIYIALLAGMLIYWFLKEAKILTRHKILSKMYDAIRLALVLCFLSALVIFVILNRYSLPNTYVWLLSTIIIVAILFMIYRLLNIMKIKNVYYKIVIYILCILIFLPTVWYPPISGAILLILLCFWVNYKNGLIVSILTFIYFIVKYYYDLHITLLDKSIYLLISGIFFLLLYVLTYKKLSKNEKV